MAISMDCGTVATADATGATQVASDTGSAADDTEAMEADAKDAAAAAEASAERAYVEAMETGAEVDRSNRVADPIESAGAAKTAAAPKKKATATGSASGTHPSALQVRKDFWRRASSPSRGVATPCRASHGKTFQVKTALYLWLHSCS